MTEKEPIEQEFYKDDVKIVAMKLLGKRIIRRYEKNRISGIIVETEAYYGAKDPASRARREGGKLAEIMRGDVGVTMIYGIHRQWLLNIVAHRPKKVGAVLIRALQPEEGIEIMKRLRGTRDIKNLTNGPGKLTQALAINKRMHLKPVYHNEESIKITYGIKIMRNNIISTKRIGVTKDLKTPLRFYIKGNQYISKK